MEIDSHLKKLYTEWRGLIDTNSMKPLINSKFLIRCKSGLITKNELDGFLAQQYYYSKHFVQFICSLMSNLKSNDDLKKMFNNLCEEMGIADTYAKPHSLIYQEMLTSFNICVEDHVELVNTRELITEMLNYCKNIDPAIGLAAICIGAEAIVSFLYSKLLNAFYSKGYDENSLLFFKLHTECDDEHALIMRGLIDNIIAAHPEKQDLIYAIGKQMLVKRAAFLDAISEYYGE